MPAIDPVKARALATDVVRQLRAADFEALWAGGCVRDRLMHREPKDYDVATNATPEQIRELFGHRRTLPIGASFGVITVLGPRHAGQIDVATFRRDAAYSDGRHPDSVTFCSAEEDARRRDFTINGLFYDPISDRVIDYVGGQEDLQRQIVRAIGEPAERFAEDKLRMLRAVRFAATLGFAIEPSTWSAMQASAEEIRVVSEERVTEEVRRMLVHPSRHRGVELLHDSRLLFEILPEAIGLFADPVAPPVERGGPLPPDSPWRRTLFVLGKLREPSFAVSFAALVREIWLARQPDDSWIESFCRHWRLSNDDADLMRDCLRAESLLRQASRIPWSRLQPILVDSRIDELLRYVEAVATVVDGDVREVEFCRERLRLPAEELDPPPLIRGDDLLAQNIRPGPIYKELLDQIRELQLMKQLTTKEAALHWVRQRLE